MRWKLIPKDKSKQPASGEYSDWKQIIADECFNQCVYCSIHEEQFGGIDHYHIDHYRPKSIPRFESLRNDIMNLFYACPICNRFKQDDWPGEPTSLDIASYPNPSQTDYASIFEVNDTSYLLSGKYVASTYLVERLYLNRPQLVYERREAILKSKEAALTSEINDLVQKTDDVESLKRAYALANKIRQHLAKREDIRPYTLLEIRKPEELKLKNRKAKISKTKKKKAKKSKVSPAKAKQPLSKSKKIKTRKSRK